MDVSGSHYMTYDAMRTIRIERISMDSEAFPFLFSIAFEGRYFSWKEVTKQNVLRRRIASQISWDTQNIG